MDLNEIAKKDKRWREIAYSFTQDKAIADDIVQEMYLKMRNIDKPINDYYIIVTLKNLWLQIVKKKKPTRINNLHYLEDKQHIFEPEDSEYELLKRAENLPFHQLEFLKESFSRSIREIAEEYNINYGFVFRETKKAKEKLNGSTKR